MSSILVVDDERSMREFLTILLLKEKHEVDATGSGAEAINMALSNNYDLVIADIQMPQVNGLEVLKEVKEKKPQTMFIMITAYASAETAVQAMKLGAYDYITKPFNVEEIKMVINKALEFERIHKENVELKRELKGRYSYDNIIGKSSAITEVINMIEKLSRVDSTVLITGESGTGKELVARALHHNGPRRNAPFVAVNCGAIPENLLESEIFGHVKGAFTGAISNKQGLLEAADKGTFFLDEVGETYPSLQVKFLRFLENQAFKRVGGLKDIQVDVRFIAASNQNLEKAVEEGRFREDLYYRLNVVQIKIPPLRERKEDIPLLVDHFLKKYRTKVNKRLKGVSEEAMECLMAYSWPGNIRELENVIERGLALAASEELGIDSLPSKIRESKRPSITLQKTNEFPVEGLDFEKMVAEFEKDLLYKAFEKANWVKKDAAELLNISFRSLRYRMEKYGIEKPSKKIK